MSSNFNFKDNKVLKSITILTLLYSVLMVLKYLENLLGFVFKPKNPLIPEYLSYYIAFPTYFILPFFIVIILLCIRFFKNDHYHFKAVYALFVVAFVFFIFQWRIYKFLMDINPYAS